MPAAQLQTMHLVLPLIYCFADVTHHFHIQLKFSSQLISRTMFYLERPKYGILFQEILSE